MSVRKRKYRDPETGEVQEVWMVDVDYQRPDGHRTRVRKKSPVQTRRGAEQYERELRDALQAGTYGRKEVVVPTLAEFSDEFINGYAKANNKPSEVAAKRWILRLHLLPTLGKLPLDRIGVREIEKYKATKLEAKYSASTVNNHLMTLSKLLRVACEWNVIERVPAIKRLRAPKPDFDFLDYDESKRLVEAAEPEWRAMILVALHTGMRLGELAALQWDDCDLVAGRILVKRSSWHGVIGLPKSGKAREIPMNATARRTLKEHRHLRGPWVFSQPDGSMLLQYHCKPPLERACKRAGLRQVQWHVLRHTFASHLAMRGVALKAIQELLGHASIDVTMRYAHLSPDVRRDAVGVLDHAPARHDSGTLASAENRRSEAVPGSHVTPRS